MGNQPHLLTFQERKVNIVCTLYTLFCSITLFNLDPWMFNVISMEQFDNYSRILKDARKFSRITKCFSRIKDIFNFNIKLKESSWRSRTSGKPMYRSISHNYPTSN